MVRTSDTKAGAAMTVLFPGFIPWTIESGRLLSSKQTARQCASGPRVGKVARSPFTQRKWAHRDIRPASRLAAYFIGGVDRQRASGIA